VPKAFDHRGYVKRDLTSDVKSHLTLGLWARGFLLSQRVPHGTPGGASAAWCRGCMMARMISG
jgi:hypothetical protein